MVYWRTPQQLRRLATILASAVTGPSSDPFWSTSAVNVLFFSLTALLQVGAEDFAHLGSLQKTLNQLDANPESDGRRSLLLGALERKAPETFLEYRAFMAMDSKVRASILATARAAVDLWSDPTVREFTATHSVDLHALRRRRTAIFFVVPEHQVSYFGLLANLFYSTCFAYCLETGQGDEELPVFFFLDEFGNKGYVHDIATVMTTLRKRRCSISIILQEFSQLRAVYGPDLARTIYSGGAANKLFFAGLDLEAAEYVERLLWQNTEYDTTFGGVSEVARTIGVPLLRADEVRMMGRDQAILVSGRERPASLTMRPW